MILMCSLSLHNVGQVSGSRCEVSKHSCFCSALRIVSASAFTVDLGASLPVSTVVVTVSSYFPEYFDDVEIRVSRVHTSSPVPVNDVFFPCFTL